MVVSTDYVDAVVVRHGVSGGLDEEQVLLTALWAVEGLLPDLTVLVDGGLVEADGALATGPPEADDGDVDLATADVGPLDERTGYRNRASTAPERYVLVSGPIPAQGELDVELAGRIDSVLRLRAPALVGSGHRRDRRSRGRVEAGRDWSSRRWADVAWPS